jgi:hypothetical protein
MALNITIYCIACTLLLLAAALVIVRKDSAVTRKEKLRLFGGLVMCLIAECVAYAILS